MATRRNTKRSLGNLLREEVQKEADPASEAPKTESSASTDPSEGAKDVTQSTTPSSRSAERARRSSSGKKAPPKSADSETPATPSSADTAPVALEAAATDAPVVDPQAPAIDVGQLRSELDQVQQQKAALEQQNLDLMGQIDALNLQLSQKSDRVTQLQAELKDAKQAAHQLAQANATLESQTKVAQTQNQAIAALVPTKALTPIGLRPALSRPIVNRPVPWEIPRRPLVIVQAERSAPPPLSDEEIGWFD